MVHPSLQPPSSKLEVMTCRLSPAGHSVCEVATESAPVGHYEPPLSFAGSQLCPLAVGGSATSIASNGSTKWLHLHAMLAWDSAALQVHCMIVYKAVFCTYGYTKLLAAN